MFEMLQLFSLLLVDGIVGGLYTGRFLKCGIAKIKTIFAWIVLYFAVHFLLIKFAAATYPFGELVNVVISISLDYLLQLLLFKKEPMKQIFVAVSFAAGRNIIRHITAVINSWIYKGFLICPQTI